jgi:hypothetical protein
VKSHGRCDRVWPRNPTSGRERNAASETREAEFAAAEYHARSADFELVSCAKVAERNHGMKR